MNKTIKPPIAPSSIAQHTQLPQQPHIGLSPQMQTKLATLNIRYRDMQETMSRLITRLATENIELKTENTTLKNQLTEIKC